MRREWRLQVVAPPARPVHEAEKKPDGPTFGGTKSGWWDILRVQSVIQATQGARGSGRVPAPRRFFIARGRPRKNPAEELTSGAGSAADEAT